jgi:hypothetical protein
MNISESFFPWKLASAVPTITPETDNGSVLNLAAFNHAAIFDKIN